MSNYSWAKGTIKIPSKVWAGFRSALIKNYNARASESLRDLNEKREAILRWAAVMGLPKAIPAALDVDGLGPVLRKRAPQFVLSRDDVDRLMENAGMDPDDPGDEIIFPNRRLRNVLFEPLAEERVQYFGDGRVKSPPAVPRAFRVARHSRRTFHLPLTKDAAIDVGDDTTIFLDNKAKTVEIVVVENNHAVERAFRHPFVEHLIRQLQNIKWTRGSGGVIHADDEHSAPGGYPLHVFQPKRSARGGKR